MRTTLSGSSCRRRHRSRRRKNAPGRAGSGRAPRRLLWRHRRDSPAPDCSPLLGRWRRQRRAARVPKMQNLPNETSYGWVGARRVPWWQATVKDPSELRPDAQGGALCHSGQVAEIVKLVRHRTVLYGDHAEARFRAAERHAHRRAGHHFQIAVASQFVAVVVAGENLLDAVLVQQPQIALADRLRYVEILSLIHISEPTRLGMISYAVFC